MDVIDRGVYDEYVLEQGEETQVKLGDDETFENVLVNQTADGSCFSIKADAEDWEIRNIGFKGAGTEDRFGYHMRIRGTGVVENVYANNKQPPNEPMGMMWCGRNHGGHLVVRHTHVEGFGNNAAYFTGQWKRGGDHGTVEHVHCYHRDNTPTNYRPAGPGSIIRDSVSVVDDPNHERAYYLNGSADKSRPIWASHTPGIVAENVQFYTNPDDVNPGPYFDLRHEDISDRDSCELTARNCAGNLPRSHGLFEGSEGNTQLTVENYRQGEQSLAVLGDGVPLTPEMAARGERAIPDNPNFTDSGDVTPPDDGDNGTTDPTRTFSITNDGSGETSYTITVNGEIVGTDGFGTGDSVTDGVTASGFVNGGSDMFTYTGEIASGSVSGVSPTLFRDGTEVSISDLPIQDNTGTDTPDDGNGGGGDTPDDGTDQQPQESDFAGVLLLGGVLWFMSQDDRE
jgi:hypothetical protein